jgi:hypothetical protein
MDKVQVALEYVRKYHFWLLSVAAVGASLMGWTMARGRLSEEYKKEKSTIESTFGSLESIRQDANPPNGKWKEEIDKLTDLGREKVASAWQSVYGEQQKVLTWPVGILGPGFSEWIKTHKPGDEIPRDSWREQYRNEIVNVEFPKLVEIVEARLQTEDADRKPQVPDAAAPAREYKVEWNPESQKDVQKSLKMNERDIPSSQVVWLRQEDLWVFRALLNIIRATNEGAQYSSNVKRINSLSIGVEAAKRFQEGMRPNHIQSLKSASDDATKEQPDTSKEPLAEGEPAPDAGRYVNDNGNPLGPGVAATEQFKRLPVYLNLEMNQNEITKLLTNCANYPLPVEVKQLRINPDLESKQSSKANMPKGASNEPINLSPTARGPLDVTVEIHGIIYIFNPPDRAKLGQPDGATAGIGG